jgi:secreted Zn-dependent insulinase-like peptidase
MQAFCGLVMREAYLEFLIAGNVRKEEAVQLAEGLAKATGALPLSASRIPERRVVRLEDGKSYVLEKAEYNPENVNSAIYQYYQVRHQPAGWEGEAPKPHRSRADADALVLSCLISCCVQIGLEELHRATYLEMLSQIAREPAFDTLRTKQQLGMSSFSHPPLIALAH